MAPEQSALHSIHTFKQLISYLRDQLGWPIESDDFEELTFEYAAEELGLDKATAVKVKEIKQLRPLSNKQPWGIFFVNFEPKQLPVVVLRRILSALVIKKRQSANRAQQAAWRLHDLLFISSYGEADHRDITFAHFAEEPGTSDLPVLRLLGWDDEDTPLHVSFVDSELKSKLRWPTDEQNVESWRAVWSSAFKLRPREVIKTSQQLAIRLADLARKIRRRMNSVLAIESDKGPLRKLHAAFKQALIHDLSEDDFADMYAQTISYGLLTARVSRPSGLVADNLTDMVPVTNPFLKELLEMFLTVGGRKGKIDFDELGVNEVVELLRDADMESVLRDFGDRNPQEDPVIHFYELFLKEYDAQKRMQRGVFYTPRPVVSFIVRSVDEILRKEFKLEDGLADTTTWGEMAERHKGLQIPKAVSPDHPFVQILDPAVGTGTFLVEAISLIHRTMEAKWRKQGYMALEFQRLWNEYVPQHLLPRLYGFELMMAPYAIAHMKIGLKLFETGYTFRSNERARVYLTNSLEPATDDKEQQEFKEWAPALAHESEAVNAVKLRQRFSVVVGNPPYSGISANRNPWIEGLLRGESSNYKGAADYYSVSAEGASLREKKVWLKDDYVKFTRLSHFMLEVTGVGIHSMITNHSYLDSPTCRGMRFQMVEFFRKMHFIDLHGSTKKREEPPAGEHDENVFDILPGVAIAVCARTPMATKADVKSFDLWGTRSFKSDWLLRHELSDVSWTSPGPKAPYFLFAQRKLDFDTEYDRYVSLKEVFPFYGTGIQTSRDDFAIGDSKEELEKRLREFFDLTHSDREVAEKFGLSDTRGWKIHTVRRASGFQKVKGAITQCLFRTFDMKWVALTKDIVDWPRLDVMSCVGKSKPGLLCSRQQSTSGFRHVLAVNRAVDMFCISNKSREGQTLFPLFLRDSDDLLGQGHRRARRPNLGPDFVKHINALLKDRSADEKQECAEKDAFASFTYVYAILYSPTYRSRYTDLLKMDYPRVPLPPTRELFLALGRLGSKLVDLHQLDSPELGQRITEFVGSKNPEMEKVSWERNTVWIDKAQSVGFKGVPESVWNFYIGGYQVCEKWLKDRKGRMLSKADIDHYQKIVIAIHETIRTMSEIDKVIDAHGGWAAAFVTTKAKSTEAGTD